MTQLNTKVCRTSRVRDSHLKACTGSTNLVREHVEPLLTPQQVFVRAVAAGLFGSETES